MATLLYITADANPNSRTCQISNTFVQSYQSSHPQDAVATLDLYKEDIGFIAKADLQALHQPQQNGAPIHPALQYAQQFASADKIVVAAPFWNLSFPAILKAYIDYVSIPGVTFSYTPNGSVGLCHAQNTMYIVARGGHYSRPPALAYDLATPYLKTIFSFFGIHRFGSVYAEGLDIAGADTELLMQNAIKKASTLAQTF